MTAVRLRALVLPLLSTVVVACGEDATPITPIGTGGSGSGTGGGAGAGASASGSGGAGTGGAGGMASGGSAGAGNAGASGAAGAGGSAGASGGAAGTAGAAAGQSGAAGGGAAGMGGMSAGSSGASGSGGMSAGMGGAAGLGGASGASGSAGANAGTSGAAGAAGGLASIAENIHQFRLEAPCIDANHFGSDKQDNCDVAQNVDRQTFQRTIGGDNATTYDVKLRIRGLTEPNTYANGTLNPPRFYVGGRTTQTGYTAYSLTVANPPEVYFFNYNATVGHFVFALDYEVVIPMRGGTTVTFDVNGQSSVPDGHGVSNRESVVIAGVPPAPDPFNGQFVQFDVVEVTERN
jgi:hypothetical protein